MLFCFSISFLLVGLIMTIKKVIVSKNVSGNEFISGVTLCLSVFYQTVAVLAFNDGTVQFKIGIWLFGCFGSFLMLTGLMLGADAIGTG